MSLVVEDRTAARVTLSIENPPLNIVTLDAMRELERAVRSIPPRTRVVVLRGAGKHFSAGADVGEHLPDRVRDMLEGLERLYLALVRVPVPTIAVVRGACLGAGLELALACDMMIVADDAKLGVPEVTLGVMPPIAAVDLSARVGRARAAELIYTGRTIRGREAAAIGLALECVPDAELDARADALAARIASHSSIALSACKQALDRPIERARHDALRGACETYAKSIVPSHDGNEGLRAFLEKRAPQWKDE
jgi:cyclohexa-1,5-dienecarbonyl-CoA hydratase